LKLRAIIVDDEKPARDKIRYFLELDSDIEIIAECESGHDALQTIRSKSPDLLFLDIQMPLMDGFSLLKRSGSKRPPVVIFVTAYDEYAVKAFETNAADYLLKPFTRKRFETALRKVKEQIRQKSNPDYTEQARAVLQQLQNENRYIQRIAVKTDHEISFLRCDQIDWIESEDNYVIVHSGKQSHMIRESMNSMEQSLNPCHFLRIHRGILVNVDRIREMRGSSLILEDGSALPVSRRMKPKVKQFFLKPHILF
jgi:two-component system, LytTR family, response regulator